MSHSEQSSVSAQADDPGGSPQGASAEPLNSPRNISPKSSLLSYYDEMVRRELTRPSLEEILSAGVAWWLRE